MAKLMRTHLFSPAVQSCDEVDVVQVNLSDTWVAEIWQYIARYFPSNLAPFHDLHILPSETGKLAKLRKHSAVIVLNHNVCALPECIQSVCKAVGVRVVKGMIAPVCTQCYLGRVHSTTRCMWSDDCINTAKQQSSCVKFSVSK